jgi:histone H3/H4
MVRDNKKVPTKLDVSTFAKSHRHIVTKSSEGILSKAALQGVIREAGLLVTTEGFSFEDKALLDLEELSKSYFAEIIPFANDCANHASRTLAISEDLELVARIRENNAKRNSALYDQMYNRYSH